MTEVVIVLAFAAAAILGSLALLHLYWVVGGSVGYGITVVPYVIYRVGMWILSLVFAARAVGDFKYIGFFKTVKTSKFAKLDTLLYTPLCACLVLIFLIMVLNQQWMTTVDSRHEVCDFTVQWRTALDWLL